MNEAVAKLGKVFAGMRFCLCVTIFKIDLQVIDTSVLVGKRSSPSGITIKTEAFKTSV